MACNTYWRGPTSASSTCGDPPCNSNVRISCMTADAPHGSITLRLFNSMTRTVEDFHPTQPGTARVYSCGPPVYSFQHIGNMRAYVFTDTLARALRLAGLDVTHIINITDVGHLTSDADLGEDKLEKASA